jgi:hypothetical protein
MTSGRSGTKVTEAEREQAQAKSKKAFNDLLTAVLPEVERCLPDWKKITSGK